MFIIVGIIVQLVFAVLFFFLCIAFFSGAPFVPSTAKTARSMILLANITPESVVYDLGSGDGRLLFASAQKKAKKVVGLEINPLLVLFTNFRILFSPYRSIISCHWQNFWMSSFHDADVVFVYLLPWKMERLKEKLEKELHHGSRVVSNSFIFPEWTVDHVDKQNHVYTFVINKKTAT